MSLSEELTVGHLVKEVSKSSKGVKNCQAVTLDKVEIASITKLEDIKAENFYLLINQHDLLKIVSLETTDAEDREKMYQRVENYCDSIGVPFIEKGNPPEFFEEGGSAYGWQLQKDSFCLQKFLFGPFWQ